MRLKIKSGNCRSLCLLSFVVAVLFTSFAVAQDKGVQVRMRIEPQEVVVGEPFNVLYEVSSNASVEVDGVVAPQIDSAEFLGQSRSKRVNAGIVMGANGLEHKTTQTQVFQFQYAASRDGSFVVSPGKLIVDGKNYTVNGGRVTVMVESLNARRRKIQKQLLDDEDFSADPFENIDRMEDAFNKLLQRQFGGGSGSGYQAIPNINAQDAFAIVAEVDKTSAYKGEQITATWYLYTKAGVREIDTLKYPNLKGFWKEDIELATLLTFQPAELNGQQYNKALLASYALFPIEAGKALIDSYRAKVTVLGGFGRAVTNTKNSADIPILVKPLPEAPLGAVFSGAVGEFQMKAASDSTSVVAHQPFAIKVRIDGRGNAKQFELPNFQLPSNVELYDIKKEAKFFKDGLSYKEFEVLLIPREEGNITIPALSTTIFNPKTEKYETLSTTAFEFRVLPGSGQQTMASNRIQKEGEEKLDEPLTAVSQWTPSSAAQWVPNAVGFAALFGGTGLGFFVMGLLSTGMFSKPETLKDTFEKRFKHLRTLPGKNQWRELGVEATNLVNFVLGRISGEGGADVHIDRLIDKLPPSVRKELAQELRAVMNRFYVLGFGPDIAVQQAVEKKEYESDINTLHRLMLRAIELSGLSS